MPAIVHIWGPGTSSEKGAGHASMSLSDGTHISWWPAGFTLAKLLSGNFLSSPANKDQTLKKDIELENGTQPKMFVVNNVNEERIAAWWRRFKEENTKWRLLNMNCSTVVFKALCAGNANFQREILSFWNPGALELLLKAQSDVDYSESESSSNSWPTNSVSTYTCSSSGTMSENSQGFMVSNSKTIVNISDMDENARDSTISDSGTNVNDMDESSRDSTLSDSGTVVRGLSMNENSRDSKYSGGSGTIDKSSRDSTISDSGTNVNDVDESSRDFVFSKNQSPSMDTSMNENQTAPSGAIKDQNQTASRFSFANIFKK